MLRLFMSIDVVGSTLFKAQRPSGGEDGWLKHFQAFFSDFPIMMIGQIALEFHDEADLPRLDIWKVLGDELLFVGEPQSAHELTLLLRALFKAMRRYEDEYLADLALRLKGTSWIAAFPTPNIEIEIPELSGGDSVTRDFLGPDIDLGFRLGKWARPSSIAVSLDLVELLLDADNRDLLDMFLIGREPLKGVFHGRPYPIIWVRPADESFAFFPWEIEDCSLMATATAGHPTSAAVMDEMIGGMRHYLRKVHGTDRARPSFDRS